MNLLLIALLLLSCNPSQEANADVQPIIKKESGVQISQEASDTTILLRVMPPVGYIRADVKESSFQHYLRTLKLKPSGSVVKYYNGASKANNGVYQEVVDLDIGTRDLHQCADAVMRLKAEYLWRNGKYDKIHFNFTNGFKVDYSEWMKGRRVVVNGNKTNWNNRSKPSNTYKDFWKYMELVFAYAGTASLEKELVKVMEDEAEIGDILIQGGFPGHAVIIVDKAKNEVTGKPIYLMAQSYMPAQEIQILKNPDDKALSPWFELNEGTIKTPEWTFERDNLKRFVD
jgi:hypothetical protein